MDRLLLEVGRPAGGTGLIRAGFGRCHVEYPDEAGPRRRLLSTSPMVGTSRGRPRARHRTAASVVPKARARTVGCPAGNARGTRRSRGRTPMIERMDPWCGRSTSDPQARTERPSATSVVWGGSCSSLAQRPGRSQPLFRASLQVAGGFDHGTERARADGPRPPDYDRGRTRQVRAGSFTSAAGLARNRPRRSGRAGSPRRAAGAPPGWHVPGTPRCPRPRRVRRWWPP